MENFHIMLMIILIITISLFFEAALVEDTYNMNFIILEFLFIAEFNHISVILYLQDLQVR